MNRRIFFRRERKIVLEHKWSGKLGSPPIFEMFIFEIKCAAFDLECKRSLDKQKKGGQLFFEAIKGKSHTSFLYEWYSILAFKGALLRLKSNALLNFKRQH